jgi:tripartite-type tricarboxylate transporter receptor subunit TctC
MMVENAPRSEGRLITRRRLIGAVAPALLLSLPPLRAAAAQGAGEAAWPTRPVRLVMPGGPGGNPDIVSRIFAQRLSDALGQPFVVENRPGAAGIIGAEIAMQAPPDGSTLLFGFNQLVSLNPLLYRRLPYDVARMTPIARLTRTSFVMLVPRDFPAKSFDEFVALAKAQPGKIVHGNSGPGAISYLFGELLRRDLGADLLSVTYRNTAVAELIAGQVQLLVEPSALAVRLTQGPDPRVRALVQLGPVADPALPGVPLLRDTHPGYVVTGWHGIWGPPGLPKAIVDKLSATLIALKDDAWLRGKLDPLASYLHIMGPDGLTSSTVEDRAMWEGIIRERNIVLD